MNVVGQFDVKKDTFEEKEMHWDIPDFFSLSKDHYHYSPDFKFLHSRCNLCLDTDVRDNPGHVGLELLVHETESSYDASCTFGIKKSDGSVIRRHHFKHTFSNLKVILTNNKFFEKKALSENKSELVPENTLTIVFTLKLFGMVDSTKLTELNTLSENLKNLLTDDEFCDATLNVKEREFKAHKIILASRSTVFSAMFKHDTTEKKSGVVNILDCDPDSFPEFLEFLYCGKLENISPCSALHLYKTADKYDVLELKNFCIEYMKSNLKADNVCNIILLADEYDETDLLAAAQAFFNENLSDVFDSDGWKVLFKKNFNLSNKLLKQMALKVKVLE